MQTSAADRFSTRSSYHIRNILRRSAPSIGPVTGSINTRNGILPQSCFQKGLSSGGLNGLPEKAGESLSRNRIVSREPDERFSRNAPRRGIVQVLRNETIREA
jgi:hypothetical protein